MATDWIAQLLGYGAVVVVAGVLILLEWRQGK